MQGFHVLLQLRSDYYSQMSLFLLATPSFHHSSKSHLYLRGGNQHGPRPKIDCFPKHTIDISAELITLMIK